MDYDWRGFLFLFLALLIFIAIILLIAGGIILIQRMRDRRKPPRWEIPPDEFSG